MLVFLEDLVRKETGSETWLPSFNFESTELDPDEVDRVHFIFRHIYMYVGPCETVMPYILSRPYKLSQRSPLTSAACKCIVVIFVSCL